jgi:uncharacterized protein (TIGR03067 family)
MSPHALLALTAFALAVPAWADEPKEKDKPAISDKDMKGTWIPTEGSMAGQKLTDQFLNNTKLLLNEGKYTVIVGEDKEEGTYKVDTSKPSPYPLDIETTSGPNKGRKIPAIVEVNGDTMKVCYNMGSKDRPKDFKSTAENKFVVMTYKREKK